MTSGQTPEFDSFVKVYREGVGPFSPRDQATANLYARNTHCMKYSIQIKSISFLNANAAEVVRQSGDEREPRVITQNGEAKAVMQEIASCEETQGTLALLNIRALATAGREESGRACGIDDQAPTFTASSTGSPF
jgi:prevent-host-death family protein